MQRLPLNTHILHELSAGLDEPYNLFCILITLRALTD